MKPCSYLSHEHPIRFAHRGSTILWPENTMTAFQGAVDSGCIYIETDLHVTIDGVLVTFHDDKLERLTNGKGWVKDWNWEDLRKLDAAYHFNPAANYPLRNSGITIPSLEKVMTTFPNLMLNLDLKQPGIEQNVVDFIKKFGYENRVMIASFKAGRVRRFRSLSGSCCATSAGYTEAGAFWVYSRIGKSYKIPAAALQVPPRKGWLTIVDEKLIKNAHALGIQVHVWTVNEPQEMQRLIELGVDGIITDRIDLLNRVLSTQIF